MPAFKSGDLVRLLPDATWTRGHHDDAPVNAPLYTVDVLRVEVERDEDGDVFLIDVDDDAASGIYGWVSVEFVRHADEAAPEPTPDVATGAARLRELLDDALIPSMDGSIFELQRVEGFTTFAFIDPDDHELYVATVAAAKDTEKK
jgi:hypothetical protein